MKNESKIKCCLLACCVVLEGGMIAACGGEGHDTPSVQKEVAKHTHIIWTGDSVRIATGGYGRVKDVGNGRLMAVYEHEGSGCYKFSHDGGRSWGAETILFPRMTEQGVAINMANAELIRLSTGELIFAMNRRPQRDGVVPFGIILRRSTDGGATWSDEQVIYEAGKEFGNGCWEPAFLELPDGTVQIYFANEGPYTHSDEQEISMLSSDDKGATWSTTPVKVCFRNGHRDGMPVPALFGHDIVVAIEDNGGNGRFKPYTVRTSLADNWHTFVDGDSPYRHAALKDPMDAHEVGSAPYLICLPTGEALLSYQTTEGRNAEADPMARCTMEVALGDKEALNFVKVDRPFRLRPDANALWNSLVVIDANTVGAVAGIDGGIVLKRGLLVRR